MREGRDTNHAPTTPPGQPETTTTRTSEDRIELRKPPSPGDRDEYLGQPPLTA
jgi:hypothetical protein